MFGGSIGNKTLTLLSYAVLLVSVEPPPFVLNALVDSQCIFLETSGFQPRLDLLPVSIRVEVDPVSGCGCIVGRNTKAYHLTRLFTYASGGMAHMRRENEMRDSRFRTPSTHVVSLTPNLVGSHWIFGRFIAMFG